MAKTIKWSFQSIQRWYSVAMSEKSTSMPPFQMWHRTSLLHIGDYRYSTI
ncbi:MAG: hypothetical protein IJA10_08540 [Lachnospiraceae bacterium]|nr:hypothetical protein [Lachnospiraceae bacterium]